MRRAFTAICIGVAIASASGPVWAATQGDEVAGALFGAIAGAMLNQDNDDNGYYYEAPPYYYEGPVYRGYHRHLHRGLRRGRGHAPAIRAHAGGHPHTSGQRHGSSHPQGAAHPQGGGHPQGGRPHAGSHH